MRVQLESKLDRLLNRIGSGQSVQEAYPIALPHYTVSGSNCFYGASLAGSINAQEVACFNSCDGATSLERIVHRHGLEVISRLSNFLIVWHRPAIQISKTGAPKRRCVVLSAFPEDALMAMGGWLLAAAPHWDISVVVCCSVLNKSTSPNAFRDIPAITAICSDEFRLGSAMLGVEPVILDFPDFATCGSFANRISSEAEKFHFADLMTSRLYQLLMSLRPEAVFGPADVTGSPERRILLNLVIQLALQNTLPGTEYHLYGEATASPLQIDEFLAQFEDSAVQPEPWFADTTQHINQISQLSSLFRCRSSPDVASAVESALQRNGYLFRSPALHDIRESFAERYWTLRLTSPV